MGIGKGVLAEGDGGGFGRLLGAEAFENGLQHDQSRLDDLDWAKLLQGGIIEVGASQNDRSDFFIGKGIQVG